MLKQRIPVDSRYGNSKADFAGRLIEMLARSQISGLITKRLETYLGYEYLPWKIAICGIIVKNLVTLSDF